MDAFWDKLNDDQKATFDKMFSDSKYYTESDFTDTFGKIPGFDEISDLIKNYYSEGIGSISERLNAGLAQALGRAADE